MKTIDFITLGCSKNLVDTERLMAKLEALGYNVTHDSAHPEGDIAIINTCGFIGDAKEESINTILEYAEAKNEGRLEQLYVMGCLSERYLHDLETEIPEVDAWFGKFDYMSLCELLAKEGCNDIVSGNAVIKKRCLTTPSHYAYVKISEGCNRACSYCAIPIITGHHVSRPMDEILDEVRWLVANGVKEVQVIAQELTYYGMDLYKRRALAELIDRMADIPGLRWIRLHYAYPTEFPRDVLDVMRKRNNVCRYLDIALQHISTSVLKRMHRNVTREQTLQLIADLRREVPGICLRTTLMVGFPGETDEDFEQLLDFVREAKFERMGAFAYSEEDGTYAAKHYEDDVPDEVKQQRLDRLMELQQEISAQVQASKVGKTMPVVIDRIEGEYYIGRTEMDSPDVDPEVLVKDCNVQIGEFYDVKIIGSDDFDLYGVVECQDK